MHISGADTGQKTAALQTVANNPQPSRPVSNESGSSHSGHQPGEITRGNGREGFTISATA